MDISQEEVISSKMLGKDSQVSIDSDQYRRMSVDTANIDLLSYNAARATNAEHSMTLREGLRLYPKAIMWSVILSTSLVMEGFDTIIIGNLYAYDPFKKQFGHLLSDGSYELTAAWQSGLSNGILVGEILGLFATGYISERYGYRKTIIGALLLVIGFIFIPFFSKNIIQLLIGEILLGMPWGVFQTITTTYASEVCPVALRAYLTTYVNFCWVLGQLIASGVLRGMLTRSDQWGYRIPFALQWMWPVPIIIGTLLAPESPWWLVRRGRLEDARAAQLRLTTKDAGPEFDVDEHIAMIQHTNILEKAAANGAGYKNCFQGTNLRRTEIACAIWTIQTLCGSSLMGYSSYFYRQAGLAAANAFTLTMAQFALGAIGTIASWGLMQHYGRRTLYLSGQAIMCVLLLITGFLGMISRENAAAQWTIGSLLLVYTLSYNCTVGPVCYSLVAEMPSTRLKNKTIVLARNVYNLVGIITNILTPRMLNPTAWDWGAKSGFFWAVSCFLCFLYTFFRLPEPKGRSYAELDILFDQKVGARHFSSTTVNPFMTYEAKCSLAAHLGKNLQSTEIEHMKRQSDEPTP